MVTNSTSMPYEKKERKKEVDAGAEAAAVSATQQIDNMTHATQHTGKGKDETSKVLEQQGFV